MYVQIRATDKALEDTVDIQPAARANQTIPLCMLEELPVGLGRAFNVDGRSIAVFRTRAGNVFAVDARCPHKGGPLADGMLAGDAVVCPLHAFRFDLTTGQCDQPDTCAVRTYAVQQKDGVIHIALPSPANLKEPQ